MPKRSPHPREEHVVAAVPPRAGGRYLLPAVVFVCGAVLMALEIVGSRMLAPFFGNSIFVWGSLISVVLAALSLGYWLGGILADRRPKLPVLAFLIAVPGIIIALLPLFYVTLNRTIANSDIGARTGPLLSCLILFLVPSIFLGTISPFAVRLQAQAVASVGSTAGTLYAVSTAGSILGTLATAFYLIAVAGVANIVHGLGLTLLVVAAALFFLSGRKVGAGASVACLVALLSIMVWHVRTQAAEPGLLLESDSFYNHIRVAEAGDMRYIDFENLRQSAMSIPDPFELKLRYTRFLATSLLFQPDPKRALILGLGGGSFPKRLHKDFPGLAIDVVDIDPEVIRIAKEYFKTPEDSRLRLVAKDGRRFVQESTEKYDLIFLDAYNSDTIPFHLTTREFYREIAARLAPGGVVVSNIIGSLRGPQSAFFRSLYRTLGETFPTLYTIPTYDAAWQILGEINIILIATQDTTRLTRGDLVGRAGRLGGKLVPALDLAEYAAHLSELPVDTSGVPTLTDDFAPVEILRAL
jgi:spermidine synthase/putative effector of murein hydrolase LrgA (UPF0299 family)